MALKEGDTTPGWVTLRSSYAVPLGRGRIKRASSSDWIPIEAFDPAGLEIPALDSERLVRFPGYEELWIPPGPGDFELHSESSLTFRCPQGSPPLQVWEHSLQEWALPEGARASQLITTDSGIVMISNLATDPRCKSAKPFIQFQIELKSGWLVRGAWTVHESEHQEYVLGVEQAEVLDTSDLTLRALSPSSAQSPDKEWRWRIQAAASPVDGLTPKQPHVPWGTLLIEPTLGWSDFGRFQALGNPATFKDMFLGGTYLASTHSQDWSEIGQTRFVFDGSPEIVQVESGWIAKAHLVDSQTHKAISRTPVRLDMDFTSDEPSTGSFRWNGHVVLTTNDEGLLSTTLFTKVPISLHYEWAPPTQANLRFKIRGYEEVHVPVTRSTDSGALLNLGQIEAIPLTPDFRVRLLNASQALPDYAFLGIETDSAQSMLDTWPLPNSDRLFGAKVGGSEPEQDQSFLDRIELASSRAEGLVLSDDLGHLHACSFLGGIWQEVPSRDWTLPVHKQEGPEDGRDLLIGYTWRGVDVPLGVFRDTTSTWVFHAPLKGVEVWVDELLAENQSIRRSPIKLEEGTVLDL